MEKNYRKPTLQAVLKAFYSILGKITLVVLSSISISASGHGYGNSCCKYNGKKAGDCTFYLTKHELRIEWSDGLTETYKLISAQSIGDRSYIDKRGGLWHYFLYPQGNQSLKNKKNGNTIFKPLRGCVD
ncbi:putative conserved secreted protein [Synechococcus sp. BIOS-E4-1]|nr:putative conserved secreted protein [Synechococcus sp. BIOS-E4-1]